MIAGVLLLFAARVCSSDSPVGCVSNHEVECITLADILNASGHVNVYAGKNLSISLENGHNCQWTQREITKLNGSHILNIQTLSEADSGEYTMLCQTRNSTLVSVAVHLHVITKRPTKPKLILNPMSDTSSPWFKCITDGFPKPSLEWSSDKVGDSKPTNDGSVESTLSSTKYFQMDAVCCASNIAGRECSQVYDFHFTKPNSLFNLTLGPGQSLLMRCSVNADNTLEWQKDNKTVTSSPCPRKHSNKTCILKDEHYNVIMLYFFIPSINVNYSGTYTCRSGNQATSVHVSVQAESFLSVDLEEQLIIKTENINSSCLQANLSYHPFLQNCTWETPDKMEIKCSTKPWVTNHRNVKLCEPMKTGTYRIHVVAGGIKKTKSLSVCIADTLDLKISIDNNTYIATTMSVAPVNYSWMSCSNDSCDADSSWEVIAQTVKSDLNVSCRRTIKSLLSRELVSGLYVRFCVNNSLGQWCKIRAVHFTRHPYDENSMLLKTGSISLLLVLTIVTILLVYFIKKKKPKYEPQLQMIQMVGPNDNDYIYINFKDFAYDLKWEFPRENLELGKELGSGAFGMVVQATAYGINKPGVSQQVAVKMLKEKHQAVEKEALMSELKMLTHIGHHANIVNLLGACTETGPTYLIFQYCCHGDLLNYLKDNSQRYHKSVTDAIMKDYFSSLYHNLQQGQRAREMPRTVDTYVPMHSATTRGQENIALLTLNSADNDMDCFEDTDHFGSPDEANEDLQALTFGDLLSFAYQVAKGMEFLSSKNCIHRDLAARNVLVTKGRMAKIGDFGLARDIDNDSNYVVRGNVRLPVKWMAPESIFQGMYTMQSDVWAYGILLWEIFSLGVTPYPGMKVDHTFYAMIERGFKMECPYYANESVYSIMCKCWELDSCNRPSFSKLVSFMAAQLTEIEEKLYHNMLDSNSNDYQNVTPVLEITALTKQTESKTDKTGNDYCPSYKAEESKGKVLSTDTAEEDGKLQ